MQLVDLVEEYRRGVTGNQEGRERRWRGGEAGREAPEPAGVRAGQCLVTFVFLKGRSMKNGQERINLRQTAKLPKDLLRVIT